MGALRVAIVSRDARVRERAARAFDEAPASWVVSLHDRPVDSADVIVCGPDVSCDGAIPFDWERPSSVIERVTAAASARDRNLVVVAGAAGGVGTTTLALHLAGSLAATDVCYLDLDEHGGGALRLGLEDDHLVYEEGGDVRAAALPVAPRVRAVFAPNGAARGAAEAAASSFDWVVVDAGRVQRAPVLDGGIALLVCGPSVACARAARRVLEASGSVDWAVISNRIGPGGETTRAELEALLGRRIVLELPCSPALRDAEDDGRLVTSVCSRYLRRVRSLARALERR